MLHVWNMYLHFPQKSPSYVGKYTSTMVRIWDTRMFHPFHMFHLIDLPLSPYTSARFHSWSTEMHVTRWWLLSRQPSLKKIWVRQWGNLITNIWKNRKCSKPPSSSSPSDELYPFQAVLFGIIASQHQHAFIFTWHKHTSGGFHKWGHPKKYMLYKGTSD